jgi:hypothetical protein
MDTAQLILLSLLSFLLLLATLNLVLYAWSKITLIFLIVLHLAMFKSKQLKKWILSSFGKKSEIPSDSMNIDWSDLEILSDFSPLQETAQPLYKQHKCDPQKPIERYITQKSEEGLKGQVYQGLVFILIGFIIALILKK